MGFSLKTQSVISGLPILPSSEITSFNNLDPTPFPALSGDTYSENKWPFVKSAKSLPKLAKPRPDSPSAAIKVYRPGFGLAALVNSLVAASISIASRTASLIKFRYEIFQQALKIVTSEAKSWLVTGRMTTFESLAGL